MANPLIRVHHRVLLPVPQQHILKELHTQILTVPAPQTQWDILPVILKVSLQEIQAGHLQVKEQIIRIPVVQTGTTAMGILIQMEHRGIMVVLKQLGHRQIKVHQPL